MPWASSAGRSAHPEWGGHFQVMQVIYKESFMKYRSLRIPVALLLLAAFAAPSSKADPIVAGTTDLPGTAIMDLTIIGGTQFNPGPTFTIFGLSGYGSITLNRDTQVGNTIDIPTLAGGMYHGSDPILGDYVFGNVGVLTGADFSGVITNVVQNDPNSDQPSSFQSGDFTFGGNSFGFTFLSGPASGLTLYTDPAVPFEFSSTFDGLPPSAGTVLANSGPDILNIFFDGVLVAQSANRRIVLGVVPEPSSCVMLGIGGMVLLGYARRRKASVWQDS